MGLDGPPGPNGKAGTSVSGKEENDNKFFILSFIFLVFF